MFMADFEDSSTPTWDNLLQGQINLCRWLLCARLRFYIKCRALNRRQFNRADLERRLGFNHAEVKPALEIARPHAAARRQIQINARRLAVGAHARFAERLPVEIQ